MRSKFFNLVGYRRHYFKKDRFGKGRIWVIYIYAPYISTYINKFLKKFVFKKCNVKALKYNKNDKYICYLRRWFVKEITNCKKNGL